MTNFLTYLYNLIKNFFVLIIKPFVFIKNSIKNVIKRVQNNYHNKREVPDDIYPMW